MGIAIIAAQGGFTMAARKRRVPGISLLQFGAIVTATLALSLLVGFAYKMNSYAQVRERAQLIQERHDEVQAEHDWLLARKAYVQTNEYAEKVAREEFRWSRYGDQLVSVHMLALPTPTPIPTATSPASNTPGSPTVPQWEAWYRLFFRSQFPALDS